MTGETVSCDCEELDELDCDEDVDVSESDVAAGVAAVVVVVALEAVFAVVVVGVLCEAVLTDPSEPVSAMPAKAATKIASPPATTRRRIRDARAALAARRRRASRTASGLGGVEDMTPNYERHMSMA